MVFQHIGGVLLHFFTKTGFIDIRTGSVGSIDIVLLLIKLLHTHSLFFGHALTCKFGG